MKDCFPSANQYILQKLSSSGLAAKLEAREQRSTLLNLPKGVDQDHLCLDYFFGANQQHAQQKSFSLMVSSFLEVAHLSILKVNQVKADPKYQYLGHCFSTSQWHHPEFSSLHLWM